MNKLFKTKQDVLGYLHSCPRLEHQEKSVFSLNSAYVLAQGEYAKPEYKPVKYADGWAINAHYFYYSSTYPTPKKVRVSDEYLQIDFVHLVDMVDSTLINNLI